MWCLQRIKKAGMEQNFGEYMSYYKESGTWFLKSRLDKMSIWKSVNYPNILS